MLKKTMKHYISEIDQRLAKFDRNRPKSFAEKAERAKYERISQLRDNPEAATQTGQAESDPFDF